MTKCNTKKVKTHIGQLTALTESRLAHLVRWGPPAVKHSDDVRATIDRDMVGRRCGEADDEFSRGWVGRAGDEQL